MLKEVHKDLKKYSYMIDYEGSNRNPIFCYGMQCGPGWRPYILDLLEMIKHLDVNRKVRLFQIKEKFGGLRVYYNGHELTEEDGKTAIENQVKLYTSKVNTICEKCGEQGQLETIGRLIVLCDKCLEKKVNNE